MNRNIPIATFPNGKTTCYMDQAIIRVYIVAADALAMNAEWVSAGIIQR